MNDMNTFEQQLASGLDQLAGPRRSVDAIAISRGVISQSPKWRFQSMFSAAKFVVAGAVVALFGGFLLAGVLTQPSEEQARVVGASPSATSDLLSTLVTEEVEPGVYRVLSDDVGHDLLDLRAAMQRLDPDDRALLAMRYVAGFNATELSAALGISPSGTRNRLERLLARLREELTHE